MKVKTLLKTFEKVEYIIASGCGQLERGFIGQKYMNESDYEDKTVVAIRTVADCDIIFIMVK